MSCNHHIKISGKERDFHTLLCVNNKVEEHESAMPLKLAPVYFGQLGLGGEIKPGGCRVGQSER